MNYTDSTMLIVGDVPQYFFDNVVIAQTQDITKTIHRPTKQDGPIIRKDRPWERVLYFTVSAWSVLQDVSTGEYRCWYEDFHVDPKGIEQAGSFSPYFSATSYARSKDGLSWEKPQLDYFRFEGEKTNIVIGDPDRFTKCEGIGVFEDPLDPDPKRRYKAVLDHVVGSAQKIEKGIRMTRDARDGLTGSVTVEIHHSADGFSWTPMEQGPRFGRHGPGLGDCFAVFPDVDCGVYRLLTRAAGMESVHYDLRRPRTDSFFPPNFPHDPARMNRRRVYLSESADLIHWSRPQCILAPDEQEDNLDDSYYGMTQFKMGEVYVGFLNVLHQVTNTMDVRLVYSRDGWRWYQLNKRQPWLSPSEREGAWDRYMVNISSAPVAAGDEMLVYHGGAANRHDWWIVGRKEGIQLPEAQDIDQVAYGLGVAKLRQEGFVSVDAGAVREGILVTHGLRTGNHGLSLNAACGKDGYLKVEITDQDETVLEGFSHSDCDTFTGDATCHRVTWKGRSHIPHRGTLRLRFTMRNASLYSFTFVEA